MKNSNFIIFLAGKSLNIYLSQDSKPKRRPQTAKTMTTSLKPTVRKVKLTVEQRNIINAAKKNIFSYFKRVWTKQKQTFSGARKEPRSEIFSAKDEFGNTALYYAVDGGHFESVALILKTGMNINITNEDGNTCLHKAMIKDNERMINYLVARGADINALNSFKQTPLFYASGSILKKYGYTQKLAWIDSEQRPKKKQIP